MERRKLWNNLILVGVAPTKFVYPGTKSTECSKSSKERGRHGGFGLKELWYISFFLSIILALVNFCFILDV